MSIFKSQTPDTQSGELRTKYAFKTQREAVNFCRLWGINKHWIKAPNYVTDSLWIVDIGFLNFKETQIMHILRECKAFVTNDSIINNPVNTNTMVKLNDSMLGVNSLANSVATKDHKLIPITQLLFYKPVDAFEECFYDFSSKESAENFIKHWGIESEIILQDSLKSNNIKVWRVIVDLSDPNVLKQVATELHYMFKYNKKFVIADGLDLDSSLIHETDNTNQLNNIKIVKDLVSRPYQEKPFTFTLCNDISNTPRKLGVSCALTLVPYNKDSERYKEIQTQLRESIQVLKEQLTKVNNIVGKF